MCPAWEVGITGQGQEGQQTLLEPPFLGAQRDVMGLTQVVGLIQSLPGQEWVIRVSFGFERGEETGEH